jgi:5-methyltetrahydrofolate--homocysteine methyltransferase
MITKLWLEIVERKSMDFMTRVNNEVVLFDGGIGTELQAQGLQVGDAPEKWNLDNSGPIINVHQKYVKAGAMVVTTNSFGGSPHKLLAINLEKKAYEVNKAAASHAKLAVGNNGFVAGSVGPTGAMLMMGDLSESDMVQGFEIQISGLVDGGADLIIIETMSDIDEVRLALKAALNMTKKPVIVSFTFEPGSNGFRTMMGVDIASAVKVVEEHGAHIVGTNCGVGIDNAVNIVSELRKHTELPIIAEPNAGLPQLVDGKTQYLETPKAMAAKIPNLINAGANMIGGCCGTTPAHIAEFRKVISNNS